MTDKVDYEAGKPCEHTAADADIAFACDGLCPRCLQAELTSLRSRVDRVVGEMREEAFDKRGDCLMSIEGDVVLAWADQLMEGDK